MNEWNINKDVILFVIHLESNFFEFILLLFKLFGFFL